VGQLGALVGELKKNRRFDIRIADAPTAILHGLGDDLPGRHASADNFPAMQSGVLRDIIILAVRAAEVAANRGNGIRKTAGEEVEKRFLFNGVNILADESAVHQAVKNPVPVLPHLAYAPFPFLDVAIVRAEITLNLFLLLISDPLKKRLLHAITSCRMIWFMKRTYDCLKFLIF
jgi:hypothetical protein